MRVLVTGASGFVGSAVVRACTAAGHETVAVVRDAGSAWRLAGITGLTVLEADLREPTRMREVALGTRPDLALHLAWSIGPDVHDSPANVDCLGGSLALLRGLDEAGCRRVVFTGTYLEHAPSEHDLAETSPIAPQNLYAVVKHALHEVARAYAHARGLQFAWARLFNLYGPREHAWPLVPTVIRTLRAGLPCELSDGAQVRAYLHVDDAARALLAIGLAAEGGDFNVGGAEPLSVRELVTRVGTRLGHPELLRFGARPRSPHDTERAVADIRRLRELTGFAPKVTLDAGLAETIAWWYEAPGPATAPPPHRS